MDKLGPAPLSPISVSDLNISTLSAVSRNSTNVDRVDDAAEGEGAGGGGGRRLRRRSSARQRRRTADLRSDLLRRALPVSQSGLSLAEVVRQANAALDSFSMADSSADSGGLETASTSSHGLPLSPRLLPLVESPARGQVTAALSTWSLSCSSLAASDTSCSPPPPPGAAAAAAAAAGSQWHGEPTVAGLPTMDTSAAWPEVVADSDQEMEQQDGEEEEEAVPESGGGSLTHSSEAMDHTIVASDHGDADCSAELGPVSVFSAGALVSAANQSDAAPDDLGQVGVVSTAAASSAVAEQSFQNATAHTSGNVTDSATVAPAPSAALAASKETSLLCRSPSPSSDTAETRADAAAATPDRLLQNESHVTLRSADNYSQIGTFSPLSQATRRRSECLSKSEAVIGDTVARRSIPPNKSVTPLALSIRTSQLYSPDGVVSFLPSDSERDWPEADDEADSSAARHSKRHRSGECASTQAGGQQVRQAKYARRSLDASQCGVTTPRRRSSYSLVSDAAAAAGGAVAAATGGGAVAAAAAAGGGGSPRLSRRRMYSSESAKSVLSADTAAAGSSDVTAAAAAAAAGSVSTDSVAALSQEPAVDPSGAVQCAAGEQADSDEQSDATAGATAGATAAAHGKPSLVQVTDIDQSAVRHSTAPLATSTTSVTSAASLVTSSDVSNDQCAPASLMKTGSAAMQSQASAVGGVQCTDHSATDADAAQSVLVAAAAAASGAALHSQAGVTSVATPAPLGPGLSQLVSGGGDGGGGLVSPVADGPSGGGVETVAGERQETGAVPDETILQPSSAPSETVDSSSASLRSSKCHLRQSPGFSSSVSVAASSAALSTASAAADGGAAGGDNVGAAEHAAADTATDSHICPAETPPSPPAPSPRFTPSPGHTALPPQPESLQDVEAALERLNASEWNISPVHSPPRSPQPPAGSSTTTSSHHLSHQGRSTSNQISAMSTPRAPIASSIAATKSSGAKSSGTKSSGAKSSGTKSSGAKSFGAKPSDTKSSRRSRLTFADLSAASPLLPISESTRLSMAPRPAAPLRSQQEGSVTQPGQQHRRRRRLSLDRGDQPSAVDRSGASIQSSKVATPPRRLNISAQSLLPSPSSSSADSPPPPLRSAISAAPGSPPPPPAAAAGVQQLTDKSATHAVPAQSRPPPSSAVDKEQQRQLKKSTAPAAGGAGAGVARQTVLDNYLRRSSVHGQYEGLMRSVQRLLQDDSQQQQQLGAGRDQQQPIDAAPTVADGGQKMAKWRSQARGQKRGDASSSSGAAGARGKPALFSRSERSAWRRGAVASCHGQLRFSASAVQQLDKGLDQLEQLFLDRLQLLATADAGSSAAGGGVQHRHVLQLLAELVPAGDGDDPAALRQYVRQLLPPAEQQLLLQCADCDGVWPAEDPLAP